METIGWPELLVIAIVFVVLFGAPKLPEFGKAIGESIRNFKSGLSGDSAKEATPAAGQIEAPAGPEKQ